MAFKTAALALCLVIPVAHAKSEVKFPDVGVPQFIAKNPNRNRLFICGKRWRCTGYKVPKRFKCAYDVERSAELAFHFHRAR